MSEADDMELIYSLVGYALALEQANRHLLTLLPQSERIDGVYRRLRAEYPERAVRELLSNMVIHQDLSDAHSSPVVSVFNGRIVFSNPGESLVPKERMLNAQPKSRNSASRACCARCTCVRNRAVAGISWLRRARHSIWPPRRWRATRVLGRT